MPSRLHGIALFFLAITAEAQSIFTIAGGGTADGRPATTASLNQPAGIDVDASGNIYIADTENHRVRMVSAANGLITTIAGNGSGGNAGDGGPATAAGVQQPSDVVADRLGNIYITDFFRVRRVDAARGIISSFGGITGVAITIDQLGNLYVANGFSVKRIDASGTATFVAGDGGITNRGDGIPATSTSVFAQDVAVDKGGNLYIAEFPGDKIRKVDARTGIITTIGGGGNASATDGIPATSARLFVPNGIVVDDAGNVFFSENNANRVQKIDGRTGFLYRVAGGCCDRGDGGAATKAALVSPTDVSLDRSGNLYIAERFGHRVRKVDSRGIITTVAGLGSAGYSFTGDQGLATNAALNLGPAWATGLTGLAFDRAGNLYIADTSNHRVRKIDASTRKITTIAGDGRNEFGEDGIAATASSTASPRGIAVDSRGNVYVATYWHHRIRKIDPATGLISTVAGNGAFSFSGDGGPAALATLYYPSGLAVDAADNLYVADSLNNRVRKIDARSGIITTVASASLVSTITADPAGNIYFASDGLKRINASDGTIQTVGNFGGRAIAVDAAGDIYLARADHRVEKRNAATLGVTTVAGTGVGAFFGDGGPATAAGLFSPGGLALDRDGNLYIADIDSNRIRFVPKCVTVDAPRNLSPANGESGVSTFPRLTWSAVKGAFHYDILLDTVNPPVKTLLADITINAFAPSNLEPLTTYYWQVVAKGDPFCIPLSRAASAVQSFTTRAACSPPGNF